MNIISIKEKIFSKIYEKFLKIHYKNKINIKGKFMARKGSYINIDVNGKLEIGDGCFFNNNCSLNCKNEIIIGDNCLFGENVKMYDHNHKFQDKNTLIKNQGYLLGKIAIGNNCWIGSNVTTLKDVKIGNNVIIGANCLVYKSIPDNSIVKSHSQIIIDKLYDSGGNK